MEALERLKSCATLVTPHPQVIIANKHQFNDLENTEIILREHKCLPATFSSPRRALFSYHFTESGNTLQKVPQKVAGSTLEDWST